MIIEGILPAILTPFDSSGHVDTKELRKLARHQLDAGAQGFFVCGSAGEGVYMSPAERRLVIENVVGEAAGQAAIIAHVGAMSTGEAAELARGARDAGATAVASMPPLVFKQPWASVVYHIRTISEAAELPTYYYHIPVVTNVAMTPEEIGEMVEGVPGLAGLKFSSPDLFLLWCCLRAPKRSVSALYGCDQQLYHGLLTGACGGIGSTYNYQIENVVGLYRAFKRGDQAAALAMQDKINKVVEIVFKYGGNRAIEKAMTSLLGFKMGTPRRPNQPFPEEKLPALRRDMELAGLL